MNAQSNEISPAELASEAGSLMTGLGVLSFTLFPFALPALVLVLPLALPLVVVALPAVAIWLLMRGVSRLRGRTRRTSAGKHADAPAALEPDGPPP